MSNLDREKYLVQVLVFDTDNNFVTSYYETVHADSYPTTADKKKSQHELKSKLALTAYYHEGYTLVSNNEFTGPVMVSKNIFKQA